MLKISVHKHLNTSRCLALFVLTVLIGVPGFASESYASLQEGVDELVEDIVSSYYLLEDYQYRNIVAVADVVEESDSAERSSLGSSFSEMLIAELSSVPELHVVDRDNLQEIYQEYELVLSGVADEETAAELGNLAAADMILVGSIDDYEDNYIISAKLVEVETSIVLTASTIIVPKKEMASSLSAYQPSKHSIGLRLFSLISFEYLPTSGFVLGLSYSYRLGANSELGAYAGLMLTEYEQYGGGDPEITETTFGLEFPTGVITIGYTQYFLSGKVQPLLSIEGGVVIPYSGSEVDDRKVGFQVLGALTAGVRFANPVLSFKPAIGWAISTADEYSEGGAPGYEKGGYINNLVVSMDFAYRF